MCWKRMIGSGLALVLGWTLPAPAQPDVDVLIFDQAGGTQHGVSASVALGYTWVRVVTEGAYLQCMPSKQWDLVIFEMPEDRVTKKEEVAGLLEDHVAAGGRLLVNFNNLDEWPRLQKLLGVDEAISFDRAKSVFPLDPVHITLYGVGPAINAISDPWPDSGDELVPSPGSTVLGTFPDKSVAIVLNDTQQSIVNGFDWDSMGANGSAIVQKQLEYLMNCRADFDQSTGTGALDIFDFLEFQTLFVQQHPMANIEYDTSFDIFDFLAFQNAFVNGCP